MRSAPIKIVNLVSMAAPITSFGINLNQIFMYSVQGIWTGAPVGTLKLQGSNDNVPVAAGVNPAANVVNWDDLFRDATGVAYSQAISGAGHVLWNVPDCGYLWVQAVYLFTSGTGSLTVNANIKGA